ncbi:MAG: HAD family hydrolase [Elusimicrobiota bacterium]|jgi:D-glycero-D-manno-heptose 1,7-bisphosphate phosphatase|nr:HAD family hydrolase [Elusimicrobiota bacterium]
MNKKIAVFIDRDGTINREAGYINHESKMELLQNSSKAIKLLNDNNILAIVCTNQSGIARGYFDEKLLEKIHSRMITLLELDSAKIDDIFYCPHHISSAIEKYKKDCNCRKPKTGMLDNAAKKYSIDLQKSYIIGDKYTDVIWGHKARAKSILVLTGYGQGEYEYQSDSWEEKPDYIAVDLYEACKWILEDIKKTQYFKKYDKNI